MYTESIYFVELDAALQPAKFAEHEIAHIVFVTTVRLQFLLLLLLPPSTLILLLSLLPLRHKLTAQHNREDQRDERAPRNTAPLVIYQIVDRLIESTIDSPRG